MIELRDICKTYKAKKGKSTKALNGVSLTLGEKGMTFILGKSGSGKSTLLNVLGGLDKYDSGEMFILGKSSKDFTQADLDSYRNTYVGFVFQEFNILEDYDVYQNILLALQLQQKKVDEKKMNELLETLELTELKKRKVNELSGGQKQRVAIARALIKEPKIILADEPTGNLDSKTGRQVMELLQEISKDKLVVVVSHDEEYAEKYGDRIIEIQDGKVVSDTKPYKEKKKEQDFYQTIKSHLPFKESFKLGIGSLKHKKLKLFFTILLVVATLGFLSCTDTLTSYNLNLAHAKLLSDEGETFVQAQNFHIPKYDGELSYVSRSLMKMDEDTVSEVNRRLPKQGYEVYRYTNDYSFYSPTTLLNIKMPENSYDKYSFYHPTYFDCFADIVVVDHVKEIVEEKLIGREPKEPDEIVISSYLAKLMILNGVYVHESINTDEFSDEHLFTPKDYEEIVNSSYTYYFGETGKVKIVGIMDYDIKKYEILLEDDKPKEEKAKLLEEFSTKVLGTYNKIYVTKDFVSSLNVPTEKRLDQNYNYIFSSQETTLLNDGRYIGPAILGENVTYYDGTKWTTTASLKKNEVILNLSQLVDDSYRTDLEAYYAKHPNEDINELQKKFFANYISKLDVIGKIINLKVCYGGEAEAIENFDVKIVGVSTSEVEGGSFYVNYFSEELLEKYQAEPITRTGILYVAKTTKEFKKILDAFPYHDTLSATTSYSDQFYMLYDAVSVLRKITFYIGLVFTVFAIFLIANFMFNSISYRKREIGVLRALGARSSDVSKIFLWEGVVLATISGVIASILLVVVTNGLNAYIMKETSLILTPFIVGIRQFLVIWILVFSVTMVASILPIRRIAKKKPIDAILNK